jgi:hypothetical protein
MKYVVSLTKALFSLSKVPLTNTDQLPTDIDTPSQDTARLESSSFLLQQKLQNFAQSSTAGSASGTKQRRTNTLHLHAQSFTGCRQARRRKGTMRDHQLCCRRGRTYVVSVCLPASANDGACWSKVKLFRYLASAPHRIDTIFVLGFDARMFSCMQIPSFDIRRRATLPFSISTFLAIFPMSLELCTHTHAYIYFFTVGRRITDT